MVAAHGPKGLGTPDDTANNRTADDRAMHEIVPRLRIAPDLWRQSAGR